MWEIVAGPKGSQASLVRGHSPRVCGLRLPSRSSYPNRFDFISLIDIKSAEFFLFSRGSSGFNRPDLNGLAHAKLTRSAPIREHPPHLLSSWYKPTPSALVAYLSGWGLVCQHSNSTKTCRGEPGVLAIFS